MFEDVLYCRLHFEMMTSYGPPCDSLDSCPPPPLHSPSGDQLSFSPKPLSLMPFSFPGELYPGLPHPGMLFPGPPPGFPGPPDHWPYGPPPDFGPGLPEYQFNNNNEPIKKRRGRKKRKVDEFAAMNGYMEVKYLSSTVSITESFYFAGLPPWYGGARGGPGKDEACTDVVQAPPAADHEGPLPDQPEPRLQGAQDALTEDRSRQESSPGGTFMIFKIREGEAEGVKGKRKIVLRIRRRRSRQPMFTLRPTFALPHVKLLPSR